MRKLSVILLLAVSPAAAQLAGGQAAPQAPAAQTGPVPAPPAVYASPAAPPAVSTAQPAAAPFISTAQPAAVPEVSISTAPPPRKWRDSAQLSYVKTSGNTRVSTLAAKNTYNYDWSKASLELEASGLGTQSAGVVTAEQYDSHEKVSRKLSGNDYAFDKGTWSKDRFSGVRDHYELALGLGRDLLHGAINKLFTELGGGWVIENRINSPDQSYGSYRAYARYTHDFSPTASFSQDLEYLGSFQSASDYRMNADTALVTTINSHFSFKASYVWKYVNSPADGFGRTDATTSMALIFNY